MTPKHLIVSSAAAMAVVFSCALFAQTASDQASAAARTQEQLDRVTDKAHGQPPGTAEKNKDMKVDTATAADTKAHAYPTEANRQARDKAEADAAAAAGMAQPADRTGTR